MSNFNKPVFLSINNQSEMDALINAMSAAFDYNTDTHTDEMMSQASSVQELARFHDDIIRGKLAKLRRNMDENLNLIIAIRDVQSKLDGLNV